MLSTESKTSFGIMPNFNLLYFFDSASGFFIEKVLMSDDSVKCGKLCR